MLEERVILGTKSKLLYSEIALSRKPFGIGRMYIYTFLFRMTDTMTSKNIDPSSWDILYKLELEMEITCSLRISICVMGHFTELSVSIP
jgi:hypothetical protein